MRASIPPTARQSFAPFVQGMGVLFLIAAALLVLPPRGQAQSPTASSAPETAYLVRSAETLPVVLMSARTSLTRAESDDGFSAAAADVVVVGPAVDALVTGGPHDEALRSSLESGVRVVACGLAMEKVGVDEDDLLNGVDTAPNGFHELFRLQDQGYVTLQL